MRVSTNRTFAPLSFFSIQLSAQYFPNLIIKAAALNLNAGKNPLPLCDTTQVRTTDNLDLTFVA
jgi:hypothetical protein